jgi:hypothetical protein
VEEEGVKMKLRKLDSEARRELESEKTGLAKEILKSRIVEIEKVEKVLMKLKRQYESLLNKTVKEIVNEAENGNIRF